MLIDETKYNWSRTDPIEILAEENPSNIEFEKALRIYRIEGAAELSIYEDNTKENLLYEGFLPFEPETTIACTSLYIEFVTEEEIPSIVLIAESGDEKTVLLPYLNTTEGMSYINNGYNDDSTFSTAGLDSFLFNGVATSTVYVSSNHWFGFGSNSEQLKIMRRDGCSTALYRQQGVCSNGLEFLKIRFEGYTVYNNCIEANRLIFELFLLSSNDMFLNIIQTPTSGNIGTSEIICNGATTALSLVDNSGAGGGTMVSFYHTDELGKSWNIVYDMYEGTGSDSYGYLLKVDDIFYTITDGTLVPLEIDVPSAAMFYKFGSQEKPSEELLTPLENPTIYLWKAGGETQLLKATLKAYPYPQVITSVIDMSHISILGIKLLTAQFSGEVGVCQSIDNGETFSEEVPLSDWLNTDPDELCNSLNETRILILHFVLHDNATLSRFKITYIN